MVDFDFNISVMYIKWIKRLIKLKTFIERGGRILCRDGFLAFNQHLFRMFLRYCAFEKNATYLDWRQERILNSQILLFELFTEQTIEIINHSKLLKRRKYFWVCFWYIYNDLTYRMYRIRETIPVTNDVSKAIHQIREKLKLPLHNWFAELCTFFYFIR